MVVVRQVGVFDKLTVRVETPDGKDRCGVFFEAPLPMVAKLQPNRRLMLERVAAHLGSAWRLRVALCAEAPSSDAKTESVFDSRARLLHAEGETQGRRERELLLDAVKRIRQSEGIERARPEEALLRAATPGLLDVWAERVLTATSLDDVLR
jgi:hypothetical protein